MSEESSSKGVAVYVHQCLDSHMTTTNPLEIRFTAKRATYWNTGNGRWQSIARDKAQELIALGQAIELKAGQWI